MISSPALLALAGVVLAASDAPSGAAAGAVRSGEITSYVIAALVVGGACVIGLVGAVLSLFITRRESERNNDEAVKRIAALEQRPAVSQEQWSEVKERIEEQISQLFSKLGGVERGGAQRVEELRKEIGGQLAEMGTRLMSVDRGLAGVQTEVRLIGKYLEQLLKKEGGE